MAHEFIDNPGVMKELAEDEKIVWRGVPEAFPLMTEGTKKGLTQRWLGCIIVAVAFVVLYLLVALGREEGLSIWMLLLLLVAVGYVAILPIVDRSKLNKKCRYYITDRRVLLNFGESELYSLPLAGLKSEIVPGEAGCVHVDLGSCVGIKAKKRRVAAFVPKKDAHDNVSGFVIYNVANSKELRAALNK